MAQNNDGPGKRLKREQANNTLYVNNPNDPRLRMYQDSLQAAIPSILSQKDIIYMNTLPMDERRDYYESGVSKFTAPQSSYEARNRLEKANKKPYSIINDESLKTIIEPKSGYSYGDSSDPKEISKIKLYASKVQLPKRKVVFKREEIEPLAPLQTPIPTFDQSEIITPVPRPILKSNLEPQDGAMGSSLRYPAQNFMNKLKARVTGTPNMPYWVDREGIKRYPSMGENTPQDVRMWEMLKSNLNPNVPEDAAELRRIDLLRKMRPKDRVDFIRSSSIAQE